MSPITIEESGLEFGPFEEDRCFEIEKSDLCARAQPGVKSVEFLLVRPGRRGVEKLFCVEAKSSAPRAENQPDLQKYFDDIREKMLNSLLLFLAAHQGRHGAAVDELPAGLRALDLRTMKVVFVLVISTAEESWLPPLQDKLAQVLRSTARSFNIDPASIAVLDPVRARAARLIT